MTRARNYCFTSYIPELKITADPTIRYYVYQQEKCPETGKLHWQGYIEFHKAMRYSSIQKILGDPKCHLETRKGTAKQAAEYCKKIESAVPGSTVEWGKLACQGERIDIYEAIDDIRNGVHSEAHDVYLLRYPQGYKAVKAKYDLPSRRDDIKITYIWGPPRSGKSKLADQMAPNAYRMEDTDPLWMDGYMGEKTIIIDDFTGKLPITKILRLCDRYPLRLQYKGGYLPIHANHIIFTSNYPPTEVYQNSSQQEAFLGRLQDFGEIKYIPKNQN